VIHVMQAKPESNHMRTNRLIIEFKDKTKGLQHCKFYWIRKQFHKEYYFNYISTRCTSLKVAVLFMNNKGFDIITEAQWYNKEGARYILIHKGKASGVILRYRAEVVKSEEKK
jgi:peptidyl-tRNA hydrolase